MNWVDDPRDDFVPPFHGESHTDEDTLWNRPDAGNPLDEIVDDIVERLDNVMLLLTGRRRDDR